MLSSSLTDILRSFSKKEIKEFGLFVESPYYNTSEATTKLYYEIIKFYPGFSSRNFEKEYLFNRVYPGAILKEDLLRKLLSNLIKLTNEFMKQESVKKMNDQELLVLKEYSKRGLSGMFEKKADEILKMANLRTGISAQKFDLISKTELVRSEFYAGINQTEKYLSSYQNHTENLLVFYMTDLLYAAMQIKINSGYHKKTELSSLLGFIQSLNLSSVPGQFQNEHQRQLVDVYIRIYKLYFDQVNDDDFFYLFNRLQIFRKTFDKPLVKVVLTGLEYYCVSKYERNKDRVVLGSLADVYRFELSEDLFERSHDDYMFVTNFRNYLIVFLAVNIEYAEELLEKHICNINPDIKEALTHFAKMMIYFKKKDFKQSLFHINKIDLVYFAFKYDVKAFQVKLHFELGNYEQVFSQIDTFKHYIRDEDKLERYTSEIKEFLDCSFRLTKAVSQGNTEEMELLRNYVEKGSFIYESVWLLEKLNELTEPH
mgnify:CR=1 FL=1|jgi:hypothetical protein